MITTQHAPVLSSMDLTPLFFYTTDVQSEQVPMLVLVLMLVMGIGRKATKVQKKRAQDKKARTSKDLEEQQRCCGRNMS